MRRDGLKSYDQIRGLDAGYISDEYKKLWEKYISLLSYNSSSTIISESISNDSNTLCPVK
jgi:hypothetical protein